jgi:nucleoside diphosphate kinase
MNFYGNGFKNPIQDQEPQNTNADYSKISNLQKLKTGFHLDNDEGVLRTLNTAENISETQVDFVFKNIKEQINTQEKLKNLKDPQMTQKRENDLDVEYKSKYDSIISDFRIKEISKEVQNEVNKLNHLINHPTALQPIEDPFGIKRGVCKICLDECKGYSPSFFRVDNLPSICSSCHCGSSAHETLEFDAFNLNCFITSVKNEILPCLHSSLNNEDLNFTSFLVLLNLETIKNTNEYDKNDIINFLQILREGGFDIIQSEVRKLNYTEKEKDYSNENASASSYFAQIRETDVLKSNMNKFSSGTGTINNPLMNSQMLNNSMNKFEMSNLFLKDNRDTMNMKSSFQKNTTFERINKLSQVNKNLVKNAKYFMTDNINKTGNSYLNKSRDNSPQPLSRVPEQEEKENNLTKSFYSLKSSNVFTRTKFFKGLKNNINNIHSNAEISNNYLEVFKKPVLLLCLSYEYSNSGIDYFEKFYNAIKNNKNLDEVTKSISLVYYSKDRVKALWDLQATFPALFKIQKTISFVIEKPDLFSELDYEDEIGQGENYINYNSDEDLANRSFNSFLFNSNLNYLLSQSKKENTGNPQRKSYDNMIKNMRESKLLSSSIDKSTISNNKKYRQIDTSNKFMKSFSQFKDHLNYSSIYLSSSANFDNITSLIETLNNLSKNSTEKSNFINNLISYISRGSVSANNFTNNNTNTNSLNEKIKCAVTYLNKVGDTKFSSSLHLNKLDILNFKSPTEKEILSNIFFPKETSYGRVLLVLRPIIVRSGLSDAILNILKLNNFNILKRKSLVLNKFQLQFLYQMEFGVEKNNNFLDFEEYVKIMTDFNVEVCVLSKFGAVEDLKLLCGVEATQNEEIHVQASMNMMNSLENVLKHLDLKVDYEIENDLIHHDEKIRKLKYQEKLIPGMNFTNAQGQTSRHSPFTDVSSLINVNKIFLEILKEKKKNFITQDYKNLLEIKKNIVKFCSQFNIFLYNTYTEETVDQEIGFFFPEFGSIQEVFIILKPHEENDLTSSLINQNVKQILEKMNYEIVDSNFYKMSEDEFCNLFDKYFSNNLISPYEYSNMKDKFVNFNCEILRLVKSGGMIDASRIIGKENYRFLKNSSNRNRDENNFNNIDLLRENCYLLNLSSEIEFYYPIVNNNISIVEGGYLLKHSDDKINITQNSVKNLNSSLILEILSSCIKSTIGEHARFDPDKTVKDKLIKRYLKFFFYNDENKIKENFINILDHYMFSKWHVSVSNENFNERFFEFLYFNKDSVNTQISFLIESNDLGFYEVRIPILDNLIDMLDINIARTYLYSDKHFYREFSSKYKIQNLLVENLPFTLSEEKNEQNWLEKNLDLDTSSLHQEDFEGLGLNLNFEKIIDNLPIIKKRLFYKTKFESTKLFYMMCSTLCDEKIKIAPRNYHYRIKPDDITMDIRRVYETEEFGGLFFIEVVSQDFLKYRSQEWEKTKNQSNLSKSNSEYRYSLPSYLWGRKLGKICQKLITQNPISQSVENCGPLIYSTKKEKLKGIINCKNLVEYEQYLYVNILYDLKISHDSKLEIEYDIFTEEQYKLVEEKLMEVLNSEIFIKSRSQENIMLTLSRLSEINLRINRSHVKRGEDQILEKTEKNEEDLKLSKNYFSTTKKKIPQSNFDHEINFHQFFKQKEDENISTDIANKNVLLIDIFCYKGSKYRSYAAIQYLFNIVYKKLSRKSYLLNNNEEEYDKMLEAILLGFNNNIQFDSPEVNDSNKFNAFKVDYFLYVLSEIKFLLNDLHICKQKFRKIEDNYKILSNYHRQNLYERNQSTTEFDNSNLLEYQRLLTALKNNINEANINLEILFFELMHYDCKYVVPLRDNKDYIVLPKERYHIPMYFEEKWERDLSSSKYIVKKKLDKSYLMDIEIVKHLSKRLIDKNTLISESFRVRKIFWF